MSFFFPFHCHTRFVITALMAMALAYMGVANPTAHWSTPYSTGGTIFSSPAIATDGTIYIGSNDSKLHAINSDGSSKWTFTTGDWVDSTPAIGADGTVYFGSWDNQLYAVNPSNGSKLWDFNTSSSIIASPAIGVDGRVYFGSKDEFFYALESNGSLAWETYVGNAITSSAAIGQDGTIYFGDENGTFHALNQDGTTKWTYEVDDVTDTNKSILSSPAIDLSGNLYFGSGNGYCYSITDGVSAAVLNWKVGTNDRVDASPVLGQNNEVFFVSRDGYLRSVDTGTGITNWEGFTGDVFYSSPVVDANGRVYVIGYTGFGQNHLFAYNNDGSKAWDTNNSSSPLTIGGLVDSSLALDSNGNLFFGCFDQQVYSVNVGSGIADNAWPQFQRDGFRSGAWPSYSISVTMDPAEAGEVNGTGIYNQGATATLSITSNTSDGFNFLHWSNGQTGSSNPLVFTVNSNLNLTANFGLNTYNLNVNSGSGGTASGSASVTHGTLASITANPDEGYSFSNWSGDGVTDATSATTTVNMIQARTVTANFVLNSYSVNVSIAPGSAGSVTGAGSYNHGDTVTLSVTPDIVNGYSFGYWSGSILGNDNPLTFQITSDANLTANFGLSTCTLELNATAGGTVSGSGNIPYGTLRTITAIPDIGYSFAGWTGEGVTDPASATTTVNMDRARSVTANFSPSNFTVTGLAGIGGSINDINGSYSYDSNISIIATADNGYTFLNWTQFGNGITDPTSPSTILTIDGNQSIQANFTPINYDLNITTSTGGSVNSSPSGGPQPYNSVVSLIATPDSGYYFSGWQGSGIDELNSSTTTITISGDHSVQANFLEIPTNKFLLQLKANPDFAAASLTGTGLYDENVSVQISAHPNLGYTFSNWTGGSVVDENSSSTTIVLNQDLNLTANFNLNQHTLNLSASEGGIVSEVNFSYDYGSRISISATPNAGYNFFKWEGNGSVEDPFSMSTFATIHSDSNLSALFVKKSYNISASIIGSGFVNGTGNYLYDDNCTLTALPDTGYYFKKWSGNGISESNSSTINLTITQDLNITATFLPYIRTVHVIAGNGGSVTELNSSQTHGSIISLTATPYSGYNFAGWDGNATFENQFASSTNATITGDSNITAVFTAKTYTLAISVIGNGSSSGAGNYSHGESISLSAQAEEGYTFDKWQGDGISDSNNSTLTIMIFQDLNLTATFIESPPQLNQTLEVVQFGSSWYSNDWFGYFYQSPSGCCYHFNLGWIYPEIQTDGSLWVWSAQLEWLWMDSTSYATSHAWSAEDNDWVYFDFLSDPGPRIFHFNNESWDTFDKNKIISVSENLF